MKTVVAALIKKDGKYLIAKRSTGPKELLNLWEFPGGKVENNETEAQALEREILEELNTVIVVGKLKAKTNIDDKTILKLYECEPKLGAYTTKDHSEIDWVDDLTKLYSYDLAPADMELLEQIKPVSKKPHLSELVVGQSYENVDLMRIFCVSGQGGMRRSIKANCLVLVSKHDENNPYDDKWSGDRFEYTGMGLSGDQSADYAQNKTLAESDLLGIDLYLFESFARNNYIYRGRVKLDSEPYYETQKDEDGKSRRVVKFSLKLI